jgi:hypothetical protein
MKSRNLSFFHNSNAEPLPRVATNANPGSTPMNRTVTLPAEERGQSRVLTQFKKSEKFGGWQDNCELNTPGRFTM